MSFLGGGLRPPSEPPPGMAPAKPALEQWVRALALALVLLGPGVAAAEEALAAPYEQALRELRMNSDGARRAWAAVGLAQGFQTSPQPGPHPKIIDALTESVRLDPDPTVRALAAYGLCLLGKPEGVPPLIEALRLRATTATGSDEWVDERVRVPLAYLYRALVLVDGKDARDFLVSTSSNGLRSARVNAISTLGGSWIDEREIDAQLERLLAERDPAIKGAATWALDERRRSRSETAR